MYCNEIDLEKSFTYSVIGIKNKKKPTDESFSTKKRENWRITRYKQVNPLPCPLSPYSFISKD